ncbi:Actin-related protein 2/3 complex subunit 5 [Yarrowia sp. C11]|nr:Actin-related protein 2/3 complex subunit 5 [Yarrowia sp. E02]KAG5372118.1 Actin-related protein 2/3 complex subunit 5 [Yarrowia sp. C11]
MSQIDFRRIDVDQYDPDSFISKEDLTPPCKPVSAAEQQQVASEIRGAISRGEATAALPIALDFAPYGGDDQVKDAHLKSVIEILSATKSAEIPAVVKGLNKEQQDVLIKYLYKAMGSPQGQSQGVGAILLAWYEKTVDITGQGAVVRYMSDRRTV